MYIHAYQFTFTGTRYSGVSSAIFLCELLEVLIFSIFLIASDAVIVMLLEKFIFHLQR